MDLSGKIVNNCYIIREKIFEDSVCTVWISYTLFAAKKFLLKFFKREFFRLNQKDQNRLKIEILSQNNYINHENVANILEFDEYEGLKFLAIEISEGFNLYDYLNSFGRLNADETFKLINEIAKGMEAFHKKNLVFGALTPDNIWISSNQNKIVKVKLLNYGYNLLNAFGIMKGNESYKKFVLPDILSNKNNNLQGELYSIGAIAYCSLTGSFNLESVDVESLKNIPDSSALKFKIINITGELLRANKSKYKNIYDLINDLPQISQGPKKEKSGKLSENAYNSKQVVFSDMFEARRKYFEDLEFERRKKISKDKGENIFLKSYEVKKQVENLGMQKMRQIDERQAFYKNEDLDYFKKLNEKRKSHLDSLINQTRVYYKNLSTDVLSDEKSSGEYMTFLLKISGQMKKYAEELKNENIAYYRAIMKKSNSLSNDYDEGEINDLYNKRLGDTKEHFDSILGEAKKYYINLAEEAKKYSKSYSSGPKGNKQPNGQVDEKLSGILNETMNYYKGVEKDVKDYYSTIVNNYRKSYKEINEKLKLLKTNKEIISEFNDNLAEENVELKFIKRIIRNAYYSQGNLCLIDSSLSKNAAEYIYKFANKYKKRNSALIADIICTADEGLVNLVTLFKSMTDSFQAIKNDKKSAIIKKVEGMLPDYKNILFENPAELLFNKKIIKMKPGHHGNELVNASSEFILNFNENKLPLIIIVNDFHYIDINLLKAFMNIIKSVTIKPVLIFGLFDHSKLSKKSYLNGIL